MWDYGNMFPGKEYPTNEDRYQFVTHLSEAVPIEEFDVIEADKKYRARNGGKEIPHPPEKKH